MDRPRIWVLVADGDTARLYCGDAEISKLTSVLPHELTVLDAVAFPSVARDRRVLDEPDIWSEPPETWGMREEAPFREGRAPFANLLARMLRDGVADDAYDGLIIAASPHIMGTLDRALSAETRARLLGQIVDDLMHLGPAGLSAYLRQQVFH